MGRRLPPWALTPTGIGQVLSLSAVRDSSGVTLHPLGMAMERCDIEGCEREASAKARLTRFVTVAPRRSSVDPVPVCARHAAEIAAEVERQVAGGTPRRDPNRNPSNRAMSSEDLGDAEE